MAFKNYDWLKIFEQPITMNNMNTAQIYSEKYFLGSGPDSAIFGCKSYRSSSYGENLDFRDCPQKALGSSNNDHSYLFSKLYPLIMLSPSSGIKPGIAQMISSRLFSHTNSVDILCWHLKINNLSNVLL